MLATVMVCASDPSGGPIAGPQEHAVSFVPGADDGDLRSRLRELAQQRRRFG